MTIIEEIFDSQIKEAICRAILNDLPQWFGIAEATEEYCIGVKDKTFFAARENDRFIGFISLLDHNKYTSEIYVVGVYRSHRNKGIGSLLLNSVIERSLKQNKMYLSVKTLAESHESREYMETREFYLAKEFVPLEVFPDLWGAVNPCLYMLKKLK
ncbi:MAG: GNAT family N-acetyltransferase [Candidatus Cloacimonetes bacterium]|nr:GNAT family N-acetyltransferase [Candidatus Cloacimonadota bacterium]